MVHSLIVGSVAFGVAYIGKAAYFLPMNPLHVAIFSIATSIFIKLGPNLAQKSGYLHNTVTYRLLETANAYIPAILAVALNIFSPMQTLASLSLTNLSINVIRVLSAGMESS